jgi:hypothetical protein
MERITRHIEIIRGLIEKKYERDIYGTYYGLQFSSNPFDITIVLKDRTTGLLKLETAMFLEVGKMTWKDVQTAVDLFIKNGGMGQAMECDICYEKHIDYSACNQCAKRACIPCRSKLNCCPFCRYDKKIILEEESQEYCDECCSATELKYHKGEKRDLCEKCYKEFDEAFVYSDDEEV